MIDERIIELFRSSYDDSLKDGAYPDSKHMSELSKIEGEGVGEYVFFKIRKEPFLSRDLAYTFFNALPGKYKRRLPHLARREIVSDYKSFLKYWNKGIAQLCLMQRDVYYLDVGGLTCLLSELARKCSRFEKKNLNGRGCFSLTEVINHSGDVCSILCFSGQVFTGLKKAIAEIKESGMFQNPKVITESNNVRYYICPEAFVTYAEAKQTGLDSEIRMFSCCERKTFCEYDWQDVDSFKMIVKYQPCELCQWPVYLYKKMYSGSIKSGMKLEPLKEKELYDSIAKQIYMAIHKDHSLQMSCRNDNYLSESLF